MASRCFGTCLALSLVLIFPAATPAQETARTRKPHGLGATIRYLVPPEIMEDLKLTSEQARQVRQLEREFTQQRRETMLHAVLKIVFIVDNSGTEDEGAEPAPVLAVAHEVTGTLLQLQRARVGFEKKVFALLDKEQKETYRKLK